MVEVTANISVIHTSGANIGVFHGADGLYMVDCSYKRDAEAVTRLLNSFDLGRPRLLIATHWHHDHVDASAYFAGQGIPILAHENTYARMATRQFLTPLNLDIPAQPEIARPKYTFTGDMSLRANGDTMRLIHLPNAHSDGDLAVYWEEANVLLANDFFVPEEDFPFVDIDSGGNYLGFIDAVDRLISMSDGDTRIIPGHDRTIARKQDMIAFRARLADYVQRVDLLQSAGKSMDEVRNADLFRDDYRGGLTTKDWFAQLLYRSIEDRKRARAPAGGPIEGAAA
jgi:glyoxylase-like metal-dependent hydrolase (beta-lactamase superfamily II)